MTKSRKFKSVALVGGWPSPQEWQKLLDPFTKEIIAEAYADIASKRDEGVSVKFNGSKNKRTRRLNSSSKGSTSVSV